MDRARDRELWSAAVSIGAWFRSLFYEPMPLVLPPLEVRDGWLVGDDVEVIKSHPSWHYAQLDTPKSHPLAIVAHASATRHGTARTMAERRRWARTKDDRPASWHISVDSDRIVQMASLEVGCWHAIGLIKGAGAANRVSNGIELVGFEKGPWPEAQVHQACRVWRALVQAYRIPYELAMVPHAVIDPKHRTDPGKQWMKQHAETVLRYAFGDFG